MHSITWRLIRWYTLILVIILFICGFTAFWWMRYLLFNEEAQQVENAIFSIKQAVTPSGKHPDFPELTATMKHSFFWIQFTDPKGHILYSSNALGERPLAPGYAGPPKIYNFQGKQVYLAGAKIAEGILVQVARPLKREILFLNTFARILSLLLLIGLLLASIGGWILTRAAVHPIQNLIQAAKSINATDLTRRITPAGPNDELYRLIETFNQMLDRLEQGFLSQQEFLTAVSHDLRTPLTVIKSYLDILNRWGKEDPALTEEALSSIKNSVLLIERLVNDFLLLAKMQSRPNLDIKTISLHELVEEIVREAQAVSLDQIIECKILEPASVAVDEYYLCRALWALVNNAIKFNQPGGTVSISVFSDKDKKEVILSVSDTGSGIKTKDLSKIFDRFYRCDASRNQKKGFGLGLSIAKEIVEAHGGRILVESFPGRGSNFSIVLPSLVYRGK